MHAANEGMAPAAEDASANEVFSAYMTLCAGSLEAAKDMGVPVPILRGLVEKLLLRLDDPNQRVM